MWMIDAVVNWVNRLERSFANDDGKEELDGFSRAIQLDDFSCGAKSAYMILRHFGKARSAAEVARAVGTDEDGTAAGPILRTCRTRGLTARIQTKADLLDVERAIQQQRAVLVSLDGDHWGVVFGYSRTHVFLADPSMRKSVRCRVRRHVFRRRWDRWAMFVGTGRA